MKHERFRDTPAFVLVVVWTLALLLWIASSMSQ